MKVTKLLAAVSAAALLGTTAHAFSIVATATNDGAVIDGPIGFANEVDFSALTDAEKTGKFGFTIQLDSGSFAAAQNYRLALEITGGELNGLSSATAAFVVPNTAGNSGAVNAFIVSQTATTVEIEYQSDGNPLVFELPIKLDACGTVNVAVTELRTTATPITQIEGGTATLTDIADAATRVAEPLVTCGSAYSASLNAPVVAGGADATTTLLPTLAGFVATGQDLVGTALIGEFDIAVEPNFVKGFTAGARVDAVEADIIGYDFDLTFEDITNLTPGIVLQNGVVAPEFFDATLAPTITGDVASFSDVVTPGPYEALDVGQVDLDIAGVAVPQDIAVSSADLYFDTTAKLVASEPFVSAAVQRLLAQGQLFGRHDWVGDSTRPTGNRFRATNLPPSTTLEVTMLVENADDPDDNGVYTFDLTSNAGGRATISPALMETAVRIADGKVLGEWNQADFTFSFPVVTGVDRDVDVDRLMTTDGSLAVVSAYGNDKDNSDSEGAVVADVDSEDGLNP